MTSATKLGAFNFTWDGLCGGSNSGEIPGCMVDYEPGPPVLAVVDVLYRCAKTNVQPFRAGRDGEVTGLCKCGEWHPVDWACINRGASEWVRLCLIS